MINGFKSQLLITTNMHKSACLTSRDSLMSDPGLFLWRACPAVGIFTANHCRGNILKYQLWKALMYKIWAYVPGASAPGEIGAEQWFELYKGLMSRLHQHLLIWAKWCLGQRSFEKRKKKPKQTLKSTQSVVLFSEYCAVGKENNKSGEYSLLPVLRNSVFLR